MARNSHLKDETKTLVFLDFMNNKVTVPEVAKKYNIETHQAYHIRDLVRKQFPHIYPIDGRKLPRYYQATDAKKPMFTESPKEEVSSLSIKFLTDMTSRMDALERHHDTLSMGLKAIIVASSVSLSLLIFKIFLR